MKGLIKLLMCAAIALIATPNILASSKNVKPKVQGQIITLDGIAYDASDFSGYPKTLDFLETADFLYILPLPQGKGDYCYIYKLKNSNYAILYDTTFYEFNHKKCNKKPKKYKDTPNSKIRSGNEIINCEVFEVNPFTEGKTVAYMYAENKTGTYIVVFGKN